MADQVLPSQGPPYESQWPPEIPGAGPGARPKSPRWLKWLVGAGVVLIAIGTAGSVIRVPYDTLSPGGTLNLETRVSISGTKSYPDRGNVMLLFVRERTHINLWAWLQAKVDSDIDLVKQVDFTGGNSQQETDLQDVCDMTQSQISARVAALTTLGYHVPVLPGLDIKDLIPDFGTTGRDGKTVLHKLYAVTVLQPCDTVVSADGHVLKGPQDLQKIIRSHRASTKVTLGILRAGKKMNVQVPVVSDQGTSVIGVDLTPRYQVPVHINIDTSDVSGPSAGLAMTLAIIDALTPGELTGGKPVAVTGTIDADGNVGEIGGLPQKALTARAAGARIFIVPACADDSLKAGCESDIASAKKRVGSKVELKPVSTLAQALQVLRDAGGAPVDVQSKT